MSLQKFVDAMNASDRLTRANYHVTLGRLIEEIQQFHPLPNSRVKFSCGGHPGMPHSYRGHYSDLALPQVKEPITIPAFLLLLKAALGNTYEGYKGGEFFMDERTPLWMAEYGCTGGAITGWHMEDNTLVLDVKYV